MGKIVVSKIDSFFFKLQCLQKCSRSFSGHYVKSYAHIMLTRQSPGIPWIINEKKMKDSHFIHILPYPHPITMLAELHSCLTINLYRHRNPTNRALLPNQNNNKKKEENPNSVQSSGILRS